jgi:archaemetzincin
VSVIFLLPLGTADRTLVESLRPCLTTAFGVETETAACNVDLEEVFDPGRVQYNSSSLIGRIGNCVLPQGTPGGKVLGIVARDLFIPILTYVFGEAELGGRVAVISYHRLQNELYGLPPNPDLLAARLRKEAVHELGHTYGLIHCSLQDCVMHTSTYVEDIDLKGELLCENCRSVLHNRLSQQ